jgi:hypothetical protein
VTEGHKSGGGKSGFRNGDWICQVPTCKGHNYASRNKCYKCSAPRNLPQNFKTGDWMCPQCSAHNYRSKRNCYKCKTS